MMYEADWNAAPRTHWMEAVRPKVPDDREFRCPIVEASGGYGFALAPEAVGLNTWTLAVPHEHPVLLESTLTSKNAVAPPSTMPRPSRHGGKTSVVYADGHCGSVPDERRY